MDIKPIKFKASVMWANLDVVNEMSGKFQVDLCNLSAAAVKALENMGIEVKRGTGDKEEKGFFISCKSTKPIRPQDESGDDVTPKLGNGTEVVAVVGAYEWSWKNKKGVSPSLKKLIVTKLVEYSSNSDADDVDGTGVADMESDEVL